MLVPIDTLDLFYEYILMNLTADTERLSGIYQFIRQDCITNYVRHSKRSVINNVKDPLAHFKHEKINYFSVPKHVPNTILEQIFITLNTFGRIELIEFECIIITYIETIPFNPLSTFY
ncbi:hypothetical protein HHI36_000695 [Cryptolaemus montrouzieri]|uniref:Uncharacterized protein n=1 Tax=Cryptolaemus montrouzieri TaxID=559131 RepID=A0ABD2P5I5_9CUCU